MINKFEEKNTSNENYNYVSRIITKTLIITVNEQSIYIFRKLQLKQYTLNKEKGSIILQYLRFLIKTAKILNIFINWQRGDQNIISNVI